jgi:hypothetical protein
MHHLLVSIARLSSLTDVDENWGGILNGTIADAITVIPRMYPSAVANIDLDRISPGRVADSVDQSQSLRSALSKGPLKVSYTTTEPLIPANNPTRVLERLTAGEDELQKVKDELQTMKDELRTLKDATLPIIPTSICSFIDCLLFMEGYDPSSGLTRSQFVNANKDDFCSHFGVGKDDLKTIVLYVLVIHCPCSCLTSLFRSDHIPDTTNAGHSTTSLAIADAITRMHFTQHQRQKLKKVFERFFRITVEQQLADQGAEVFLVDARWPLAGNLVRVSKMRRGSGGERAWQTRMS